MSDAQLGVLITAALTIGGGIGGVLKWAVAAVVAALVANTKSNTALSTEIRIIADYVRGQRETSGGVPQVVADGGAEVTTTTTITKRQTPAMGSPRPATQGGGS